jgi:hypothetical protein
MTLTTTLTSKLTASFVAAFVATTIALVYVLRAPHIIIQDTAIADEYYYKNAGTTLSGDLIAGVLLLLAAQYVIYATNITGTLARIGIVVIVTALATAVRQVSSIGSIVNPNPNAKTWYASVDIRHSVAYDVIFMTTLYIVLTTIYSQFI